MHKALTNLDEIEIEETFKSRISLDERDHKYADVEWVALDDKNNGNYKQEIVWDTTDMKDRLPIYRESYIALPLKFTSSGAAYTADTRLAFKCSVLSLIRTLSVQPTGSGPVLVNEIHGQLPLMNNLRLLTHSDIDWVECTGEELHFFGCDRRLPSNVMGADRALDGASSRVQSSVMLPGNSVIDNPALANRIAIFAANRDFDAVTKELKTIVTIPLKYIHPLFDQMGFVLPNYPMRIKMGLSSVTNGSEGFMPMTTPEVSDAITLVDGSDTPKAQAAIAAVAAPKIEIDKMIEFRGFQPGSCRLYVKCVILKEADRKKLDEQLSSGYKKTITYLTTDIVQREPFQIKAGGSHLHAVFAENVQRPVRVWAMFPPEDSLADAESTFPAIMGPVTAKQVTLKLNSSEFRKRPFESQYELYNELRQYQLGSGYSSQQGARITYNDYCHGMNPILFDVSRHPTVLNNLPITFTLDADLLDPNAGKCEPIFLVERYRTAVINITRNSAKTDAEDGISDDKKE